MAEHTPGPWTFHPDFTEIQANGGADIIAWLAPLPVGRVNQDDPQRAANAELLAAAPDLLAACEAATLALDTVIDTAMHQGRHYYVAQLKGVAAGLRAAITAATKEA